MSSDLNWNNHNYSLIASQAYIQSAGSHPALIESGLDTQANLKNLYITLVRSQLSYCSQIWRSHLVKDFVMLERIQRRATKFITMQSDYKQRLLTLKHLPL